MKGKNNPIFLISWRSQQDIARSLGWKCALMIWGGPALALLCLYVLLTVTHLFRKPYCCLNVSPGRARLSRVPKSFQCNAALAADDALATPVNPTPSSTMLP